MTILLALLVVFVAVAVVLGWAFFVAETMTRTKRWRVQGSPGDMRLRHEDVAFQTVDGATLRGWYMDSPGARATIVILHDIEGTRSDPELRLLDLQRDYIRRGFHVLSFDLRGRGESSGGRDSLGCGELRDVEGAVAYARRRSDGLPVVLHGFGLGAGLAIVAASRGVPVEAIIADSPFVTMRDYLRSRHPHVPAPIFMLACTLAKRIYGADVEAVRPIRAMPQASTVPTLLIHGDASELVCLEHALNLGAASLNPADEIWVLPGAAHGAAYATGPQPYFARCLAFIDAAIPARIAAASAG